MTDPLTLITLGAALGGATGKFVEKAWDSGEKWLVSYFADHRPKALEQAQVNSLDFLDRLAKRVNALEENGAVSKTVIESAQDHPDFSVAMQRAMLTAAQTNDGDKHDLLARMLSERLDANPESLRAMATKLALDAVGYATPRQLKLLALIADLMYVVPSSNLTAQAYGNWFEARFAPYVDVSFSSLDLLHLESLSCLKHSSIISRNLHEVLKSKNNGEFDPAMLTTPLVVHIQSLWERGIKGVDLSSVGQLIGVYVSDSLTGGTTSFSSWD
jgi:hypothetical protein